MSEPCPRNWEECHRSYCQREHKCAEREASAPAQPPAGASAGEASEPVAHICILPTKDAGPTKFFTAPSDPRGFPVYAAPLTPPAAPAEPSDDNFVYMPCLSHRGFGYTMEAQTATIQPLRQVCPICAGIATNVRPL